MSLSSQREVLTMICLNFPLAASTPTVMFSIKEHAVQTEEKRPSWTAQWGVVLYLRRREDHRSGSFHGGCTKRRFRKDH